MKLIALLILSCLLSLHMACPANCISCTTDTTCDVCAGGYYLWKGSTNDVCQRCPGDYDSCTLDQATGFLSTRTLLPSSGFSGTDGITITGPVTTYTPSYCNGKQYLGPFGQYIMLVKLFPFLFKHSSVEVSFNLFTFDN